MDTRDAASKEYARQVSDAEEWAGIIELLAMPAAAEVEFEPPRLGDPLLRLPELPE